MKTKKTLVIGAGTNPSRYAYLATQRLLRYNHPVVLLGKETGVVLGNEILHTPPADTDIDTVTLYIRPEHQTKYYDYLTELKPKRIIFNPGTENDELAQILDANGTEIVYGCTLVMLSTGQY